MEIEELYDINVFDVIPEFIKAPLPFVTLPGFSASFCTRVTPVDSEVAWSICGCDINDDTKGYEVSFKVSKDNFRSVIDCQISSRFFDDDKKKSRKLIFDAQKIIN